jgi:plastocyanin
VFIAMFAFLAAVFAVGIAARAVEETRQLRDSITAGGGATAGPSATPAVTLSDFTITPNAVSLPAGGGIIKIGNTGATAHNLNVGTLASPSVDPGKSGEIDVKSLKPGTYKMWCSIVGHEGLGMTGTVTVG